jgi:hypothetical protein
MNINRMIPHQISQSSEREMMASEIGCLFFNILTCVIAHLIRFDLGFHWRVAWLATCAN